MSAAPTRTLEQRQALIRQAAYEIESLAVMLLRAYERAEREDLWVRGVAVRLEALAGVALTCADDDCAGCSVADIEARLYGDAWTRRTWSAA